MHGPVKMRALSVVVAKLTNLLHAAVMGRQVTLRVENDM